MGNCSAPEKRADKLLDESVESAIKLAKASEDSVVKILLLGTGNSGKSTILKQFCLLHGDKNLGEAASFRHVISGNIIHGIVLLASAVMELEKVKPKFEGRQKRLAEFLIKNESAFDLWSEVDVENNSAEVGTICKELWESEPVQVMNQYSNEIPSMEVPIEYFMKRLDRIMAPEYVPSIDDILRARSRTSGVTFIEFSLDDTPCRVVDVGGQRNERRKWISQFDNVTAVIFIVSMAEYDTATLEDRNLNRIHDAMTTFEEVVKSPHFARVNFVLFLNKQDLFTEKIKKTPLTVCFPEYEGKSNPDEAMAYIQNKFVKLFRRIKAEQGEDSLQSDIYPFPTTATNTNNVRNVFNTCKHILFKRSLAKTGMF